MHTACEQRAYIDRQLSRTYVSTQDGTHSRYTRFEENSAKKIISIISISGVLHSIELSLSPSLSLSLSLYVSSSVSLSRYTEQ